MDFGHGEIIGPLILAVVGGGPLLMGLMLLLLAPGRKGYLRTLRTVSHRDISLEAARDLYAARFEHERFVFRQWLPQENGFAWIAERPATAGMFGTHANKRMHASIRLWQADEGQINVELTLWTGEFVLWDTGEGRMIDLMMHRLLEADLGVEPPPVVPNRSVFAVTSLFGSGLALLFLIVVLITGLGRDSENNYFAQFITACVGISVCEIVNACIALVMIARKPRELTGRSMAVMAIAISLLCIIAGSTILAQPRHAAPIPAPTTTTTSVAWT